MMHLGRSISQSRFVCQVWCSSIPDIYAQFLGGPSAKVYSSTKFCVLLFKANITCQELKSLIVIWGGVEGVTSDMPVQC